MDREVNSDWVNNTTSRIRVIILLVWIKVTARTVIVRLSRVRLVRIYSFAHGRTEEILLIVLQIYLPGWQRDSIRRAADATLERVHFQRRRGRSVDEVSRLCFPVRNSCLWWQALCENMQLSDTSHTSVHRMWLQQASLSLSCLLLSIFYELHLKFQSLESYQQDWSQCGGLTH